LSWLIAEKVRSNDEALSCGTLPELDEPVGVLELVDEPLLLQAGRDERRACGDPL